MKKVGIITFHFPTNYGAKLQCMALYKYLEELGLETEIINYRPKYHSWKYAYFRNPFYIAKNTSDRTIKDYWKTVFRFTLSYGKVYRLVKNIKNRLFEIKYYTLSRKISNNTQLAKFSGKYNFVIVGSDQIWNYNLTNGEYDLAYFADFVSNKTKRISYAPSVGNIPDLIHMNKLAELVNKFDKLSVREESLRNEFIKHGIQATKVLDPTFLLSEEEWKKVEKKPRRRCTKGFICVYSLFLDDQMTKIVSACSDYYQCDVIDLSPTPKRVLGWKRALTCDPSEFLWYIHNSKMVLADSFHAIVFSIIFQKQFVSFAAGTTASRAKDLLFELGLESRIYNKMTPIENYFRSIDYRSVDKIVDNNKSLSIQFLRDSIKNG